LKSAPGVIGAVALLALAVVAIVSTSGHKGTGAKGPAIGSPLPVFAAPLAEAKLTGDVNVTPTACSVTLAGSFTSCSAVNKGPLVLGFVTVSDKECSAVQTSLGALAAARPDATVVLVGIRGDRKALQKLATTQPQVTAVWDRDGTLANRYGIAVCPSVVVAQRGGTAKGTLIGADANDPAWLQKSVNILLGPAQ